MDAAAFGRIPAGRSARRGRALAAVMVGLMVFASCAGPEPERSGGNETASDSSAPVTPESSPHPFAGDSTWIAYQTSRSGQEGVWLVHPDGTEDHQIAMDAAQQTLLPDWSPDGGRLVFTTRGGSTEPLYEYDLAKEESRQLFECSGSCLGDDEPAYSPDGRRVAFIRANGGAERRLTTPDMVAGEPDWSPDGNWIVFATHPVHQFQCCEQSNLYRVHPDGSGMEPLTSFEGSELRATQPRYTRDGKWILFTQVTPSSRTLSALPADGGQVVAITTSGIYTHGTWQPRSSRQ